MFRPYKGHASVNFRIQKDSWSCPFLFFPLPWLQLLWSLSSDDLREKEWSRKPTQISNGTFPHFSFSFSVFHSPSNLYFIASPLPHSSSRKPYIYQSPWGHSKHLNNTRKPPKYPFSPIPSNSSPFLLALFLHLESFSSTVSPALSNGESDKVGIWEAGGDLQQELLLHVPHHQDPFLWLWGEPRSPRAGWDR